MPLAHARGNYSVGEDNVKVMGCGACINVLPPAGMASERRAGRCQYTKAAYNVQMRGPQHASVPKRFEIVASVESASGFAECDMQDGGVHRKPFQEGGMRTLTVESV
jgi:hypothetical protein